jgi:predicted Zn finger-like uncharacterized protein
MRLVCPNCEAKYEVPDDAIPDTGRDVQCTNCGHSWFQMRGRTGAAPLAATPPEAPAAATSPAVAGPAAASAIDAAAPDPTVEAKADDAAITAAQIAATIDARAREGRPLPDQDPAHAPLDAGADAAEIPADAATPDLPDMVPVAESVVSEAVEMLSDGTAEVAADPVAAGEAALAGAVSAADAVADAAQELVADAPSERMIADLVAAETVPVSAPDTAAEVAAGAPDDDTPAAASGYAVDDSVLAILREEAEREANARRAEALESQTDLGIEAALPRKAAGRVTEAEARPAARRDLLPDVEEINSTLRPSEMQAAADGIPDFVAPPPEAPRGFRSGFLTLMTIAILGAALYVVAPRLALLVPALAGPLESYISAIDSLRLGLDGMLRSATAAISDG